MTLGHVTCGFRCSNDLSIVCESDGDPVCNGHGTCKQEAVGLSAGSILDLDGHTIRAAYQSPAARCGSETEVEGRCKIVGPGHVEGDKGTAISSRGMDIVVKNITISNAEGAIVSRGKLIAKGLVIRDRRENSVHGERGVRLVDVVSDGDLGISSGSYLTFVRVELGPHGGGLSAAGSVRGRELRIRGSAGVSGRDVRLRQVTTEPDLSGESGSFATATQSLRLVDSEILSIESGNKPHLVRSSCESSLVYGTTQSWGMCSGD